MKALKISLLSLLGIVVTLVAVAAIFVATFDANRYKPEIEQFVLEQTGRTLQIAGDIELTLWPSIGAQIGQVTLASHDASQPMVKLDAAQVSVAVMPLLSGEVLVDGVSMDGLHANITRDKGGVFNFDDLIRKPAAKSAADTAAPTAAEPTGSDQPTVETDSFKFDIASIALTNASLSYTDRQNNTDLTVSALNLSTGQIAPQSSGKLSLSAKAQSTSLALDVAMEVNSDYKLKLPGQAIHLTALTTELKGDLQNMKAIDSTFKLDLAADLNAGQYTLTNMNSQFKTDLAGQVANVSIKSEQLDIKSTEGSNIAAQISAQPSELVASLASNVKDQGRSINTELKLPAFTWTNEPIKLQPLVAALSIADPALGKDPLKLAAQGSLSINAASEAVAASLAGQLDGSPLKATVEVAGFSSPAITFDVALDQINLDRFGLAQDTGGTRQTQAESSSGTAGSASGNTTATPIDLAALKGHNIKGKLLIGKVRSKGLAVDNLKAEMALANGKLSVAPHSAQLFGGKLAGSLTVDANTHAFALQENLSGVQLDSLLAALGQDPRVTGQGALTLDITTSGTTSKALEQNLAGKTSINLKDGAIKGIDIGQILNNVRAMLGKAPSQQGTTSGQTAFTELTASATIAKGIATNRDLNVKAPLFRLEGAGTINIPQTTLDYLAKVAVVETSEGQGGKDLAALKGVTVPIRITGPLGSPKYSVDVASLAAELAKSQLGDKARDEINKVVPGLGDALKGLFGR